MIGVPIAVLDKRLQTSDDDLLYGREEEQDVASALNPPQPISSDVQHSNFVTKMVTHQKRIRSQEKEDARKSTRVTSISKKN
jgi:hypothetical protein